MARSKYARLPLPAVVNPPERRCVTVQIPDHEDHWAAFWGVLFELAKAYSWEDDTAHTAKDVAQVWREVYEDARQRWIDEACGGVPEVGDCVDFDTASAVITYAPQNPWTQPDYVPEGYQFPPLYVVKATDTFLLTLGFQPGDIQTDLLDFPPGSLPTVIPPGGLPRFRVTFQGTTDPGGITVELHLVKIPAGGYAAVSVDGAIIPPPELINLHRDEIALPPETNAIVTIEKTAFGPGTHFVDCTFIPRVNEEAPFLFFGGGLNKVVICGKDVSIPVPQMEFVDCKIRFRPSANAPWQEFDISNCVNGLIDEGIEQRLEDGTLGGSQREPDGEAAVGFCKTYHVTLNTAQRWISPIPIRANYTIQITNARGGASGGTPSWYCPSGAGYVLGACNMAFAHQEPTDPIPTANHMRLIMKYNGNFYDAYNLTHTVSSSLVGAHDLEFQVNDDLIGDNAGDYQFDLQICNYGACVPFAGLGPEYMSFSFADGIFTMSAIAPNPGSNGAYQCYVDVGDQNNNPCACRKLEIVSLTGYTLPDEEDNFNGGAVYVCDGSVIVNERGSGTNWQLFYEGLSAANQCIYNFDVKSQTPFTMQFRVVEC